MTDGAHTTGAVVELGFLVAHAVDGPLLQTIERARERVRSELVSRMRSFEWRLPMTRHHNPPPGSVAPTTRLLLQGCQEREQRRWDFAIVVTSADLQTFYRPDALAAPARAIATAVVSSARLVPDEADVRSAQELAAQRLAAVVLHAFADLNSVPHSANQGSFSYVPQGVSDLDRMREYGAEETRSMTESLRKVADARLEETPKASGRTLPFYLQAMRIGWRDVAATVLEAGPWMFPLRLVRLTTASIASALLMMMTEEAWRVAIGQNVVSLTALCVLAIAMASGSVLSRQRLLLRRGPHRLTEQNAVTNLSITVVVAAGMSATFLGTLGVALATSSLFDARLIADWAGGGEAVAAGLGERLEVATFAAASGIVVGALGAAFEGDDYLRHVIYVDEEI